MSMNRLLSLHLTCLVIVSVFLLLAVAGHRLLAQEAAGADAEGLVLNGDAAAGKAVYRKHCVSCHGERGDGRGPEAEQLYPPPRNYQDPGVMAKLTDEFIYTIIKDGGGAVGKSAQMESWSEILSDREIRDVGAFIRTFAKTSEQDE